MSVPKKLHFLWTTGEAARTDDPVSAEVAVQIGLWRGFFPDFGIQVWSWAECADLLDDDDGREVLDLIRRCRFTAMKSDLLRLAILSREGGIWSDVKNRPLRAFGGEVPGPAFLAEHFPLPSRPDLTGHLCNSFLGAEAGHPFIGRALDLALANVRNRATGSVFDLTGGGIFKRLAYRNDPALPPALPWRLCWGDWMTRTGMSYNAGALHWSQRQKVDPLYEG